MNEKQSLRVQLKSRVIDKIEEGRRIMGLDVVVRKNDGSRCTENNTSVIELLHKHIIISERDQQEKKKIIIREENILILFDFKLFACNVGEQTEVFCSLWRSDLNCFVSDDFIVTLTHQGMPIDSDRIGNIKTVFKVCFCNCFFLFY